MDDPDGAEAELIAVNYWPLLMIFTSILVAKLLHGITTPMCSWVNYLYCEANPEMGRPAFQLLRCR